MAFLLSLEPLPRPFPANPPVSSRPAAMNGLSVKELCCLLCCPPCPSRIASKLAFLPPEPTYSLRYEEASARYSFHLTERSEWHYGQKELDCIEASLSDYVKSYETQLYTCDYMVRFMYRLSSVSRLNAIDCMRNYSHKSIDNFMLKNPKSGPK